MGFSVIPRAEPATLEGQVVRICDRIAYVNHDLEDAVRAGLIKERIFPQVGSLARTTD